MTGTELTPKDVGTPLPVSSQVPQESYTYDYIIVGGGTAGCVLASRLSEDPTVSVLLIEQGPIADTWLSRVPLLSGNPYSKDTVVTRWWSLPMRNANNRFQEIPRGEGLGGTSRINAMLYTRGTPGDYNRWKALGNEGWGYEDLEPFFIKSERSRTLSASNHRGDYGPWENTRGSSVDKGIAPLVAHALGKLGIQEIPDVNDPDAPAACTGVLDLTRDASSYRHSTYHAFLPPKLMRKRIAHLKICTNSIVTRITFTDESNSDDLRATGVQFETTFSRHADHRYFAKARRDVILCAGALGSPQILMLSGLGPKEHLQEKEIPVIRDMPAIGNHLQDHVVVPVGFDVLISDSYHQLETSPIKAIIEFLKYAVSGRGLFANSFQSTSTFLPTRLLDDDSVLSTKNARDLDASIPENRPDIELMHIPFNCADSGDNPGTGVFSFLVTLIRPKSEGTVRLSTVNPRARPDVDFGYLSDPEDYTPLRKGVRLALRVGEEVQKQGYPIKERLVPETRSDEDIDRFIRQQIRTCFHYTSTCRMGTETHGERPSVVDTELRVHGVRGLRVCDTSIFPEIIGSHTMAPAVMVGEKCADMLKAAR